MIKRYNILIEESKDKYPVFLIPNSLKEYIKLYVLFYKHNTSKRRTRPKILKLTCHYSNPEKYFKYSSPSSQFSLSLKKLIQL